jgi:hypothetical protein
MSQNSKMCLWGKLNNNKLPLTNGPYGGGDRPP